LDYFAGVIDFSDVETQYPLCVDSSRHIFYNPGDEDQDGGNQGQIERVNYKQEK
jgi:hypothetical protein